jgi:hypothetical protein
VRFAARAASTAATALATLHASRAFLARHA